MKLDDTITVGTKFIITYRPNTHNGVARPKLKNGKDTRQITRRAQWTDKCRIVRDKLTEKIRYITYYDLDQQGYRCAVGKVWITGQVA
jgi:hypothetical protein|tara:strand:- start:254 stop:517 length:264 start_codon:yes stop_codon:yes gene_type:complete